MRETTPDEMQQILAFKSDPPQLESVVQEPETELFYLNFHTYI